MKFGLFYLFSEFGDIPQDRIFHEVLEEIDYGEELGFDSVWLPEHHFSVYGTLGNPMTMAAVIAERTKRMLIGTAVMVLPFQHPLRLAEDAALVDALSGGWLLLRVGRGYQVPEFNVLDIPQNASRAMFLEALEIIRKAFTEDNFTHEGHFWKIRNATVFPPAMVDDYYHQMGWDVETGLPTPEILKRLDMEEFLGDLRQRLSPCRPITASSRSVGGPVPGD